jgi:5-methylcytosine-specific restriction protein B
MVLSIINEELKHYKELITKANYGELYKWEALKNFQQSWDIETEDFKGMYDRSLRSKVSNNLWANPHWFPKAVMLHFIDHHKERVRQMFRDLFNEDEGIDKRIERFVYNCDQLLNETYVDGRLMQHHFHDGQRMVSLYLAFRYPDRYAIYKYTEFKTFMEVVKAKDIPSTGEYERFFKVVRILYGILTKDEELMRQYRAVLTDDCFKRETLMLAQDFIFVTARRFLG